MTRGPAPTEYGARRADAAVERAAVDRRLGEREGEQLFRPGLAQRAAEHAAVSDPADERAGVDAVERDGPLIRQPAGKPGAKRSRDDSLALHALRFVARRVDSVVPDQRVGEAEHLRDVARVGDRLLVARHRRREARLAGGDAGGADARAGEDRAVLENQMTGSCLHN